MRAGLPRLEIPQWLRCVKDEPEGAQPFPLREILRDSLYYPASGLQGAPVQYLAGSILSFVYVDYGIRRDEFRRELESVGFKGYRLVTLRSVSEGELAPRGWPSIQCSLGDGDPESHRDWIKPFYCDWAVLQRCAGYADEHGPDRFSYLFVCADGVAAFQALYVQNLAAPRAIAIIQPGAGFGMNWTDFADPEKILGRTVLGNASGRPRLLLNGGRGGRGLDNARPWWPGYESPVMANDDGSNFLGDTGISVWEATGSS